MTYLEKAVNELVYYTPKKIVERMQADLLIKNPSYDIRKANKQHNK